MTCDDLRVRLTAYLDGELEGDRASVVRGHLRECEACRQVASDEAVLRDELRLLPPVDPPASLWAGVQARLAEAEVADARRPAWRRALARWAPAAPRFVAGGLLAAAAVAIVWWRPQLGSEPEAPRTERPQGGSAVTRIEGPTQVEIASSRGDPAEADVTAELAGEAERITATYGDAAEELLALAAEARGQWSAAQRDAFDARVAELRGDIDRAATGRPQQRAWRELIRYLQRAVVRDEIALAGGAR